MRLIDADALIQKRCQAKDFHPDMYVIGQGYVMDAPTIDPETLGYCKVVRGRYITDDMGDSKCSVCGENYLDCTKNYCPNCSAQMDAEGGAE